MLTGPPDLDSAALTTAVEDGWGLRGAELRYLPVGFGSHHWRALDASGELRFVSVDDLEAGFQAGPDADASFAALERAFATAAALAEADLEFVVAPTRDRDGAVIRRLSERYAVTVSPFVTGETCEWGLWESTSERIEIGELVGRLHAAAASVPPDLPRRHDLLVPSRAVLDEALADLDAEWTTGPYAEPARRLLAAAAEPLGERLAGYDASAAQLREDTSTWVVTHGEPHRGNTIRTERGLRLVDWDTTLVAPRERDLVFVLDDDLDGWDEYAAAAGAPRLDEHALAHFHAWWTLADIATFLTTFRRPHERSEDTQMSWRVLQDNLAPLTEEA